MIVNGDTYRNLQNRHGVAILEETILPTKNPDKVLKKVRILEYSQEPKESIVVHLIRLKYSIDDEFAIHRQKDSKSSEFEHYNTYCEECKKFANDFIKKREEIGAGNRAF